MFESHMYFFFYILLACKLCCMLLAQFTMELVVVLEVGEILCLKHSKMYAFACMQELILF